MGDILSRFQDEGPVDCLTQVAAIQVGGEGLLRPAGLDEGEQVRRPGQEEKFVIKMQVRIYLLLNLLSILCDVVQLTTFLEIVSESWRNTACVFSSHRILLTLLGPKSWAGVTRFGGDFHIL